MSERISYDDKVALNAKEEIAPINKVEDSDLNQIKAVVNDHADDIEANQAAIVSISIGTGDAFETRALAMVAPDADEVPFVVYGESGFNGQYRYLASDPSGYVNIYLYLTATNEVTKDSDEVVTSGGVETVTSLKADLEVGKNLFDKNAEDAEAGTFLKWDTGVTISNASFLSSGFIPVEPITEYYQTYINSVCWYDSSKVFISGVDTDANNVKETPLGAAFIRCTVINTSIDSFQLEIGDSFTGYEDYEKIVLQNVILAEIEESNVKKPVSGSIINEALSLKADLEVGKNKANINASDIYIDGYIDGSGNPSPLPGYNITGFIPISENTDYYMTYKGDIAWYDSNKLLVLRNSSGDSNKQQTSPSGVSFLRCTVILASWEFFQVELGSVNTGYEPYGLVVVQKGNTGESYLTRALGLSVTPEIPNYLTEINKADKDFYLMLYGDSITAWQSTFLKDDRGVCDVPPVCDRKGLANRFFNNLKFGNPIHKRFDWGKSSLVSFWDDRWIDDTNSYFSETGTFKTFYRGGVGRPANIYTVPNYTTEITNEVCPISEFTEQDSQRNIPKRISNESNASIQFTIPSGFEKADFIYNEHNDGDVLDITISLGNGKVLSNTKQNDWGNGVEANNSTLDTVKYNDPLGNNDAYGVLSKRLHFKKTDIDDVITITITKSTNISKWFSYWGVSYWGTKAQPYSMQFTDNGRGGYSLSGLINVSRSDIGGFNIDGLMFENTLINSLGTTGVEPDGSKKDQSVYKTSLDTFHTYLDTLSVEIYHLIPHLTTVVNDANPEPAKEFYNGIKSYLRENSKKVFDVESLFRIVWSTYYSENTYSNFLSLLMYDLTTHPNEDGFSIYEGFIKKLNSI